jgi:predicted small secreted protein
MVKKTLGRSSLLFFSLLFVVLFSYGCETLKGMQKDVDKAMGWDKEFQEKYW